MLNASPFARKKMGKEVEILDNEMHSRYDNIHGEDGLLDLLTTSIYLLGKQNIQSRNHYSTMRNPGAPGGS